jgi:hypothetical protein
MYERFPIQSDVASDFCGSFGVKQHSLFPPFNLPAQRDLSGNYASVSLLFYGNSSIGVRSGDRCAGGRVIMSPDNPAIKLDGG